MNIKRAETLDISQKDITPEYDVIIEEKLFKLIASNVWGQSQHQMEDA